MYVLYCGVQLDCLGDKMHSVAKSRAELAQIKQEEETGGRQDVLRCTLEKL